MGQYYNPPKDVMRVGRYIDLAIYDSQVVDLADVYKKYVSPDEVLFALCTRGMFFFALYIDEQEKMDHLIGGYFSGSLKSTSFYAVPKYRAIAAGITITNVNMCTNEIVVDKLTFTALPLKDLPLEVRYLDLGFGIVNFVAMEAKRKLFYVHCEREGEPCHAFMLMDHEGEIVPAATSDKEQGSRLMKQLGEFAHASLLLDKAP